MCIGLSNREKIASRYFYFLNNQGRHPVDTGANDPEVFFHGCYLFFKEMLQFYCSCEVELADKANIQLVLF